MKVLIYNEFVHEQHDGPAKDMYPRGMHMAIAEEIQKIDDSLEFSFATLENHKEVITQEKLAETDVLVWWGHMRHHLVDDLVDEGHL